MDEDEGSGLAHALLAAELRPPANSKGAESLSNVEPEAGI
jgi:hypothetical protein